ncbi:MAG: dihydrodipicolinate synthase family protein [Candidatus Eremiobacteraeota bacterium]|nr:dihydrodipicolinate synthase family protein [Candidatus Eremiobacteraeota bacterium]
MKRQLGTIVTAMVTPFDEGGDVDLREAARLARWLVERGNDGLVVAGSTGEGQTLDSVERVALWKAVKDEVGSDAAVVANAGTNSTCESVSAAQAAESAGVDAILAVVPYYNKPTQTGMLAHFGRSPRLRRCRSSSTTSRDERRPTCCRRRCSSLATGTRTSWASKNRAATSNKSA